MALQKNIVSSQSGVTLGYHTVLSVQFGADRVNAVVSSYVDAGAKAAGKSFVEAAPYSFPYDGSPVVKSAEGYAQDLLLTLPAFAGASVVA